MIDNFGNVLDENGNAIGFVEDGKCISLTDDEEFPCPSEPEKEIIQQPTVTAKRTYWLLLAGALLILGWIGFVLWKWK